MDFNSELYFIQAQASSILFKINNSRNESDLEAILEDPAIQKFVMNKDRYHQLNLTIDKEQLQSSIESGFIRNDGSLDESKLEHESAATKLLYAFLWKQGDLQKVKYIVQGITNRDAIPESGMVLYYFGKHLADKKHPIIDQHVIRAFAVATRKSRFNEDSLTKKDFENIQAYIDWFQNDLPSEIHHSEDGRYLVDQVLYALGKRIKKEIAELYPKIYANG